MSFCFHVAIRCSATAHSFIYFSQFFCLLPCRSVFRTKRRLSIAPLPALRLNDKEIMPNDFDSQSVISNQNSITSVNSLASLLKEKMQVILANLMCKRSKYF